MSTRTPAAWAAVFSLSLGPTAAWAQYEHQGPGLESPLGIPHTRMGSGTSWLPDDAPMYAWHFPVGKWTLMLHGVAFGMYDRQFTPRGDEQFNSTNWVMLMASRLLAGGGLHLRGMFSAEPFTVGASGTA